VPWQTSRKQKQWGSNTQAKLHGDTFRAVSGTAKRVRKSDCQSFHLVFWLEFHAEINASLPGVKAIAGVMKYL
jgi:hypothetical protein